MMTVELDDETANLLKQLVEREHIGAAQLLKKALADYIGAHKLSQAKQPELLTDIIATLPDLPTFAGDPIAIQRTMRDEWD